MKLALFDIDGTLIQRTGVESMPPIIKAYYGLDVEPLQKYDGSTSYGILKAYLEAEGIKEPEKENRFHLALAGAGEICKKTYENLNILPVDNIASILEKLEHEPIYTGLVTGNTYEMARVKMEKAGLWHYFTWGAYGGNTAYREDIIEEAITQATNNYKYYFTNKDIFVIGDTQKDILAANNVGVQSVGVATGKIPLKDLAKVQPNYLFADYSQPEEFLSIFHNQKGY